MKRGMIKVGAKYKRRRLVGGKWVYEYDRPRKERQKKPKIENFYGEGRHKYFDTEKEKKEFLQRYKAGETGGKIGRKIKSSPRFKIGTKVKIKIKNATYIGKIVANNAEKKGDVPTKFDVQFVTSDGKIQTQEDVPRNKLIKFFTTKEGREASKKRKTAEMREEARDLIRRDATKEVRNEAVNMVMADWNYFSKTVGNYYKAKVRGGWNAAKFGFTVNDLKQEAYIVVQTAAVSFLTNPAKHKKTSFRGYVKSFLKSNLASKLMAGSGSGGHLKTSHMNQMYLWFFKDTMARYRDEHNRYPSDVEMLEMLEKKREALPDEKGNKVIKKYKWNIEKVRNFRKMSKTMTSLEKNIEVGSDLAIMDILSEEEIEKIPGHYKMDPWEEVQKWIVRDSVKDALKRKFSNPSDREILTRLYGLFVDEDSPKEVRRYAQGQTVAEVARFLNRQEAKKHSVKRWTSEAVHERQLQLLTSLREDKEFRKEMIDFIKARSLQDIQEWPDAGIILYWMSLYLMVAEVVDMIFPSLVMEKQGEPEVNERPLVFLNGKKKPKGLS